VKEPSKERLLLDGLALGNRRSAEVIYKENYSLIQHFVLQNNGTSDDARDIFQEAMVVLYEKSRDPGFELTCLIRTYLYSISRRLWLKRLHQQNRFVQPAENFEELVPVDNEIEEKEQLDQDFETMELAMRHLGEPCRSLLEAFYLQKKPMQTIAEQFGYTNADNAKNQKYKCLLRLKKLFFAQVKQR